MSLLEEQHNYRTQRLTQLYEITKLLWINTHRHSTNIGSHFICVATMTIRRNNTSVCCNYSVRWYPLWREGRDTNTCTQITFNSRTKYLPCLLFSIDVTSWIPLICVIIPLSFIHLTVQRSTPKTIWRNREFYIFRWSGWVQTLVAQERMDEWISFSSVKHQAIHK